MISFTLKLSKPVFLYTLFPVKHNCLIIGLQFQKTSIYIRIHLQCNVLCMDILAVCMYLTQCCQSTFRYYAVKSGFAYECSRFKTHWCCLFLSSVQHICSFMLQMSGILISQMVHVHSITLRGVSLFRNMRHYWESVYHKGNPFEVLHYLGQGHSGSRVYPSL